MSIQEHLNKIRNAVYGREVRESIAKGIETAYDDASEKDNANMEVKIARGTHPNLRSRLEEVDNKQQQVTAQLAQKEQKLKIEIDQKMNISDFTNDRTFKGSRTTSEIQATVDPMQGDYYYSTDENVFYLRGESEWFNVGTGNELINVMIDVIPMEQKNKYLNPSGTFTTYESTVWYTAEFGVGVGERFHIKGRTADKSRLYAFVDGSGNVMEVFPSEDGSLPTTDYDLEVTVPVGAVIMRVSHYQSDNAEMSIYKLPVTDTKELSEKMLSIDSRLGSVQTVADALIAPAQYEIETNLYIKHPGILNPHTSDNYQIARVSVKKGDILLVSGSYSHSSRLFTIQDMAANTLMTYPDTSADDLPLTIENNVIVDIPEDGTLIVGNFTTTGGVLDVTMFKRRATISESEKETKEHLYHDYRHLVRNVISVGDSLTDGGYYVGDYTGQAIDEDYPYYLSKITGWNVTEAGTNGRTASSWWNLDAEQYDFSNYDTTIIWLGTNYGLTDTLAEDTAAESYLDYADTHTGNYCKIIEKALNENPRIHIHLVKVTAASGSGVEVTNNVVEQIGEKYGLQVIDISHLKAGLGMDDIIHPENGVHFGKVGNIHIARSIYTEMIAYINEHFSDYEYPLI